MHPNSDQTPMEQAMTKYRNLMTVRAKKFKQCYDRIHSELQSVFPHIQLPFLQFQLNQMKNTAISKMQANMQEWAQKKQIQSQLTFKDCWQHIDQQYRPEAEFFTACFRVMRELIENVCNQTRGSIQLLFSIRSILILLKRKDKGTHTNSGNYPILRCKAVVIYGYLHAELKRLCGDLLINKWIAFRKQKRKEAGGNTNVPAKEFVGKLVKYCEYLYEKQYLLAKDKMSLNLVNIYQFDDQKRMVICDGLTQITDTKIDHVLEWFGQRTCTIVNTDVVDRSVVNASVISPILNEHNFMNDDMTVNNNLNMNINDSMVPLLSPPLIYDSSDTFSIHSVVSNNMFLRDINPYLCQNSNTNSYDCVRASNHLTSQFRYSPIQQLKAENTTLKMEVNRLRQIISGLPPQINHHYIPQQQHVINNNNQMRIGMHLVDNTNNFNHNNITNDFV